jgi:hypothetical protein
MKRSRSSSSAARGSRAPRRLPRTVVAGVDAGKYFGVRAGARTEHRFTGIWMVAVGGRVFARSWTIRSDGWFNTFLKDPLGAIQVGTRTIRIRAVRVRSARMLETIEDAYAAKYTTPGSKMFVRGFRTARRRAATVEFVPR